MDSCVSETTSNASDYYDSEFGEDEDEDEDEICLDHVVWTKLPEELLIHVFARLPVKNILQIRSLSKSWRSTITSPQFQQAFSEASLVRISLLDRSGYPGSMFFSQGNKEECFRPNYSIPCATKLLESSSDVAGTASGLICVIDYEAPVLHTGLHPGLHAGSRDHYLVKRVFVMNMVTGVRRELPSPRIMNFAPTLAQMKANFNGGYTITFLYTEDREQLQVTSWQVYDSVKNTWSKDDDGRAIEDFKDVEVFNTYRSLTCGQFYDVPATFHKETKAIGIFKHEENEWLDSGFYPNRAHNVSGELYKLCTQEGQNGVWRLVCSSKWEMVCEFPDLKGGWTCLRVMNDLVVLIIEYTVPPQEWYEDCAHGYFVKVFHMPSKVWYSFPEDDPFITRFGYCNRYGSFVQDPFLVEIRFDSVP